MTTGLDVIINDIKSKCGVVSEQTERRFLLDLRGIPMSFEMDGESRLCVRSESIDARLAYVSYDSNVEVSSFGDKYFVEAKDGYIVLEDLQYRGSMDWSHSIELIEWMKQVLACEERAAAKQKSGRRFDFVLKVLQHLNGLDETDGPFTMERGGVIIKLDHAPDDRILLSTSQVEVVAGAFAPYVSELDDEFFEENINLENIGKCAVIENIDYKGSLAAGDADYHLRQVLGLLFTYYHSLMFHADGYALDYTALEPLATHLTDIIRPGTSALAVYSDPSTLM